MASSITRLDHCQFLLNSQINYTLTHLAEHSRRFSIVPSRKIPKLLILNNYLFNFTG